MKRLLPFVFCCFCLTSLFGQSPKTIEDDLLRSFKNIAYREARRDTDIYWFKKLETSNKELVEKLSKYGSLPQTIDIPFKLLTKAGMDISTADDKLFRIYSWDTLTGGTMHWFESIFQYKVGSKTFVLADTPKTEADVRPNYNRLYTFRTNGKAYYIAVYLFIGSTKDVGDGLNIFKIEDGKLEKAKIIKTNTGLHSELAYGYDFFSVVDIAFDKRPRIRFDPKTQTLYLPLVDSNMKMTNRSIRYKFTGQYFERMK